MLSKLSAFAVLVFRALVIVPVARVRQWQLTALLRSYRAIYMSAFGYQSVCQRTRMSADRVFLHKICFAPSLFGAPHVGRTQIVLARPEVTPA
jgi:hypothetical protein